ncbi:Histone-lysine N-methyltransferase SETMAR, partial [Harpegnathos saltator]
RHILLYYFKKGKRAADAYKKICRVYGDDDLTERVCQRWYANFRPGDFDVNDAPRSGRPIEINSSDIKSIIEVNPSQSVREIATTLNISHTSVEKHLRQMGYFSRVNVWVPHKLTE